MGLKITTEIQLPLTKDEAETLQFISAMTGTVATARLTEFEPPSADRVCGMLDPEIDPEKMTAICTYIRGHEGRHRFVNFGATQEESA